MRSIWAYEIQLSYLQKKNEKSDKRNFKEKIEKKGCITQEDNVIYSLSDLENKIISLGIMMKYNENREEKSRYIDSNFSKRMA